MDNNIVDEIIQKIQLAYEISNSMDFTRKCLVECVCNGKHLDLSRLAEEASSTDVDGKLAFASDLSGIVNNFNRDTHELDGFCPRCGFEH